jgi:hypothetical protein
MSIDMSEMRVRSSEEEAVEAVVVVVGESDDVEGAVALGRCRPRTDRRRRARRGEGSTRTVCLASPPVVGEGAEEGEEEEGEDWKMKASVAMPVRSRDSLRMIVRDRAGGEEGEEGKASRGGCERGGAATTTWVRSMDSSRNRRVRSAVSKRAEEEAKQLSSSSSREE